MTSSTNRTTDTDEDESRPRLDLSLPKVAAGALASVTTAVVASFFGVTGTLTGAAFGSVMSSVAAAVYATSLQTAGTRLRGGRGPAPGSRRAAEGISGGDVLQDPTAVLPEFTGPPVPPSGDARTQPYGGWPQPGAVPPMPSHLPRQERRARVPWQPVAIMTGVIFIATMGVIFGTELVLKHPLGDAQSTGTSAGAISRGISEAVSGESSSKTRQPSTKTPSTSSTSSSSKSESPSPSDSPSTEPTGSTDASGSPTASAGDGEGDPDPSGRSTSESSPDQDGQGRTTGEGAAPPPSETATSDGGENAGGHQNGEPGAPGPTRTPGA